MKETINSLDPKAINALLGYLFETASEKKDIDGLRLAISTAEAVDLDVFPTYDLAEYYYNLANAWNYVQRIIEDIYNQKFETPEVENQILYGRKALQYIRQTDMTHKHSQILVNLCILFNHIGRSSDAIGYINEALKINPSFGMAVGHKGMALFYYARYLWEPAHQFLFFQYARKWLQLGSTSEDVYQEAQEEFAKLARKIETVHEVKMLNKFVKHKNWFLWLGRGERRYKKWCLSNRLFLNPLNDLLDHSVAGHDYFFLPAIKALLGAKPEYHSLYNNLKQEYVSARYLFYQGLNAKTIHFSDKGVVLMETNDDVFYGLPLERMKVSFRMCYSIFDKIAWFINKYYDLQMPPKKISFRSVWYNDGDSKKGLRPLFLNSTNWPLRGLFWISKDLADNDGESAIEPEARQVAIMRNFMEHKFFKIVGTQGVDGENAAGDYEIEITLFENKVQRALQLARSAIQYLAFVVYHEEANKLQADAVQQIPFVHVSDKNKR